MNEIDIRDKVIATAQAWLGYSESSGKHKQIIDVYNSHKPLARGYKVQYTDEWCATFVSAVAIKAGLTDIMPTECSCEQMINLYKALGRWVEDDSIVPQPGDIIMYDWQDSGSGDDRGVADHVGIVVYADGESIRVIEGNYGNTVKYRTIAHNAKYIRGFAKPDYASKASVDIGHPPVWAYESCEKAVKKGVIHGDGFGDYEWDKPLTKAEIAVVLDNLKLLG